MQLEKKRLEILLDRVGFEKRAAAAATRADVLEVTAQEDIEQDFSDNKVPTQDSKTRTKLHPLQPCTQKMFLLAFWTYRLLIMPLPLPFTIQ